MVEALRPRGSDGAVAAVDFAEGACHGSIFPVGHACRGESRRIVNGEGPRAVGVGGFGRGDEEGEASRLFVHHEREIGDAAEFPGGDGGGGDDFEAPDGIMVAEIVDDGVLGGEFAAGRDLGEVNVAVGLLRGGGGANA